MSHARTDVTIAPTAIARDRRARVLSAAALLGVTYYILSVLALHVLRPDEDPIQRAVSDYAVGRFGALLTLAFLVRSAGVVCLVAALAKTLGATRSRAGLALLAIYAACGLLIAIFPTDLPGAPPSRAGALHTLFALVSFLTVTVAAFVFARAFGRDPRWRPFQPAAYVLAVLVLAGLVAQLGVLVVPAFKSDFGAAERIFILVVVVWLEAVALWVLALARRDHLPSSAGV